MCFHASSQALRSHTKPQYSLRKTDDCHFHTGKRAERQKWNQIKKKFTRYFYLLDVSRTRLLPLCTVLFGGVCAGLPGVCVCLWELILGVSICSLSSKRWTSHSCLLGLPSSSRSPSSSPPCRDTHWLTHTSEFLSNNQCFFCFCFTLKPQVRWKLKILQLTTDCPGSLIMLTDCYFYYSDIYTLQIAQQACFNIQSPDLKRPQPILKSVTLISTCTIPGLFMFSTFTDYVM